VLGRCHAALGQQTLSVVAFDAAIALAKRGHFVLLEALTIRGRALVGREQGGWHDDGVSNPGSGILHDPGSGLHWSERTGRQQLVEVMERMTGPREPLEKLLHLR
jgi:hypothetical protein